MSDVITGVGFYKLRNGSRVEVHGRDPRPKSTYTWLGTANDDEHRFSWCNDGRFTEGGEHHYDIVGPWVEPQPEKPDPGEGWRLLENGELVEQGDELFNSYRNEWVESDNWRTPARYQSLVHTTYRRRIETPKPQPLLKWLPCQWNETGAFTLYGMNGYCRLAYLAADGSYQPVEVVG